MSSQQSQSSSSSSYLSPSAPEFIPRGLGAAARPRPPKPPKLSNQNDRSGGNFIVAVLLPKSFVKSMGGDIGSVRENSSLHGLYGDSVYAFLNEDTVITSAVQGNFNGVDFDPDFNQPEGYKEIIFQLLTNWRNNKPKPENTTFQSHHEWIWSNEFKHSGEVLMNQEEYFSYSLKVFSFIAAILDPALKNCSGSYYEDGRRILSVIPFIKELKEGGLNEPSIHVRTIRTGLPTQEQELLELKFYLRATTGEFIPPPLQRLGNYGELRPLHLV